MKDTTERNTENEALISKLSPNQLDRLNKISRLTGFRDIFTGDVLQRTQIAGG